MSQITKWRRWARERALQFLFQADLNPPDDLDRRLQEFWEGKYDQEEESEPPRWRRFFHQEPEEPEPVNPQKEAARLFAEELIRGVLAHREEIDERLQRLIKNWDLKRLATADRNILRLAMFEMLYRLDIPPVVSINEAVELAKKYSTEDSGAFVNGVLDRFRLELMRPARTPVQES